MADEKSICRESDKTGRLLSKQREAPPFYGIKSEFSPEIYIDIPPYGWFPPGRAKVVQIVYKGLDKGTLRVAGFISEIPENVSEYFPKNEFRIGIRTSKIKESLESRIDAAKNLLELEKNNKIDTESFRKSKLATEALKNMEIKLNVLTDCLDTLKNIIDGGWTHIIIATAWKEGNKDRLDLNNDYFELFYPKEAFPIAGYKNDSPVWVKRDDFIWELFPEGNIVPSRTGKNILWNRYDYIIDSEELHNLKITFNHSTIDVMNENEDKVEKLLVKKKWPTVDEVVKGIIENLGNNLYGNKADRARKNAVKWAYRFLRRAEQLRKRKKNKFAAHNENAAEEIMKGVRESLAKEQKKIIGDLNGITDPMSRKTDIISKEALKNLGELMLVGGEDGEGELMTNTTKSIVNLYKKRAELQLDDLKKTNSDDPDFKSKTVKALKTLSRLMLFPDEEDNTSGKRSNDEILNETMDLVSDRITGQIKRMGDPGIPWEPLKLSKLIEQNMLLGETHKPNNETLEKLKSRSFNEIEKVYSLNPALNKRLKILISIHTKVLNGNLPDQLYRDQNIINYLKRLREPLPEESHTGDKSLNLNKIPDKSAAF